MSGIALADARRLRPIGLRTSVLRWGLTLALAGLLAAAYVQSRGAGSEIGALLPAGTSPVVVLDISASISGPTDARVLATLRTLADAKGPSGLVVFSDTAYELLPPGSPAAELRKVMRFFRPIGTKNGVEQLPPDPWSPSFKAGTAISTGLDEARRDLAKAGIAHGAVVLVSDLDDTGETPIVIADSLARLRRAGITLRIVPLFPTPENLALWQRLVGKDAIAASPTLSSDALAARAEQQHPFRTGLPLLLTAVASLLVVMLAANELYGRRLRLVRGAA